MQESSNQPLDQGAKFIQQLQQNLAYFKKNRPSLYRMLSSMDLRRVELVVTPGQHDVDMIADGKSCYRGLAKEYSIDEARKMLEMNPESKRIRTFAPPSIKGYRQENFATEILRKIIEASPVNDRRFTGYIRGKFFPSIVFLGCGLGYHIEYLVSRVQIINAIVIERDPEKFAVSLYTVNWESICENFSRKGFSITFAIGEAIDSEEVRKLVSRYMERDIPFYPFFSTYYNHLADIELAKGVVESGKDLAVVATNWSNYDNEIMRLSNTVHNLRRGGAFIPSRSGTYQVRPLVVVGSGPSLDVRIESLKAVRDKVVVVSSGTALRPLLAHGVCPDFHVELDPSYLIYELLSDIGICKIKDIPLLAVNEVNPFVTSLFENHYFYFKSDNAQSSLFDVKDMGFVSCDPTVTNAAISIGHSLGFREIYLFGTDYGFESEEQDHSSQSVYGTDSDSKMADWIRDKAVQTKKRIFQTPSVSGGYILTRNDYYSSKRALEKWINSLNAVPGALEIYNCADGAVINGAHWLDEEEFLGQVREKSSVEVPVLDWFNGLAIDLSDIKVDSKLEGVFSELKKVTSFYARKVRFAKLQGRRDLCALANDIRLELAVLTPAKGMGKVSGEQIFCRQLLKGSIEHFVYVGLCHGMACHDDELVPFLRVWEEKFQTFLQEVPLHFEKVMLESRAIEQDPWVKRNIGDKEPKL